MPTQAGNDATEWPPTSFRVGSGDLGNDLQENREVRSESGLCVASNVSTGLSSAERPKYPVLRKRVSEQAVRCEHLLDSRIKIGERYERLFEEMLR